MMPDPGQLPPSVYQGMGWSPAADPRNLSPAPPDGPNFGGLPPSVVQGMGWAPPPDASAPPPPEIPSAPTLLPSMQGQQQGPPATSATPDYQVPASAFGRGPGAPPPAPGQQGAAAPAPGRPQSFDQRMGALEQREAGTEQAQNTAIQANTEAQKAQNALERAAYQKADETVAANAAARKTEQEQWDKIYATNSAQVAADRKQVEDWKFNRNAYMDGLGVGDKVRWGIAQILSNVGRALQRQTGPDPIAEMLQQNIHDANEAQFKERDAVVQKLGIDRQTGMDAQQYHATRQAEIDKADGLAYTALSQQLKEAAVKTGDQAATAQGLKAAADVKAAADTKFSSNIQLRSQHDLQAQQNAIAGAAHAETRRHNIVQEGFEKYKLDQEDDLKAAALLLKKQGKLSDEESKRALFIPGPDGKWQLARDNAGNPVLSAKAEEDRSIIGGADAYNGTVNEMIRGINDHGGESGWFKSPEWQKMQGAYNSAVINLHKIYGVQSFRGEWTADMFKALASGGVDPTSFLYNAVPGLQESKELVSAQVNSTLHKNGYDGPPVVWQDTSTPAKPPDTVDSRALGRALLNPVQLYNKEPDRVMGELGMNTAGLRGTEVSSKVASRLSDAGGILPPIRQNMDTWAALAGSPDPEIAKRFHEALQKIASESESPATAAYAEQLLERGRARQIETAPGAANAPEAVRGSSGAPRSP